MCTYRMKCTALKLKVEGLIARMALTRAQSVSLEVELERWKRSCQGMREQEGTQEG